MKPRIQLLICPLRQKWLIDMRPLTRALDAALVSDQETDYRHDLIYLLEYAEDWLEGAINDH